MLYVGQYVEILPNYNPETRNYDVFDEIARCTLKVLDIHGNDVKVDVPHMNDFAWICKSRVRPPRIS